MVESHRSTVVLGDANTEAQKSGEEVAVEEMSSRLKNIDSHRRPYAGTKER